MKIIGLQGLDDPQSIRAEVDRGGRFVIYLYCISIVFMSFKRTSDIYFLRPGQSPVFRGLPFTLVSFFLGWWGFPWGLVYTVEALVKNLGGGIDVTESVLAQIDPPRLGATTAASESASRSPAGSAPAPMPLHGDARASTTSGSSAGADAGSDIGSGIFRLAALILAAVFIGWTALALYRGANIQTALVNGLATPVTITLDDEAAQTIAPNSAITLTLAEGDHTYSWTRPDGRPESGSFALSTPFWSRPLQHHVAVINPDRVALIFKETTQYFPDDQALPEGKNDYVLHAGHDFYLFAATDHFFEDFPAKISLSNRKPVSKSRYSHADKTGLPQRLFALTDEAQAQNARNLALRFGDLYPDDEVLIRIALSRLSPEDTDAFFAIHLEDQPLRLEWHRVYQHHVEYNLPDRDLLPHYRELAAKRPDDGSAAYLASRIETDRTARQAYLRRATEARNPCAYAHNSLAYEALTSARFPEALAHLRAAEKAGLDSYSFRANQHDILLANGLAQEAIAHVRDVRAKAPQVQAPINRLYLNYELMLVSREHPDNPAPGLALVKSYLEAIKPLNTPEQQAAVTADLASLAAYARGDEAEFVAKLAGSEEGRFAVAITRGQPAAATKILDALPKSPGASWLLVYLAARDSGDHAAADQAYARAIAAFATESREHRVIAALLRENDGDPEKIYAELLPLDEKCVLITALGHRFPQHRTIYHELAAKLNFKPAFPSLFLTRQLRKAGPTPATASL